MKRILAAVLAGVMAVSLTACGGGASGGAGSDKKAEESGEKVYKVALMADGAGFGSQSFNDVALEGLEKAKTDFGIELTTLEVKEVADFANSLRSLAQQGCDMIITPSSTIKDAVTEVAAEYPDTFFGLLDVQVDGVPNVVSSSYREHEAAFLLGALGGYMTKANQIGFIGGVSGVIQDRFQYGYMAGAWYSNPEIKVTSSYTGSFSDVGKGKEIATMMFSDGCDYVAPSAGACNLGVFQAAKEAGDDKWSFGAANGQFNQMPDKIVASQVKRVDNVAYAMVEKLINGTLKGEQSEYGLKDGGVDLMYSSEDAMKDAVPQDIKDKVEEIKKQIVDGTIKVPANEAEYSAYVN